MSYFTIRTLKLQDLLPQPVMINGMLLDARVDAVVEQRETGPAEVLSLEVTELCLHFAPGSPWFSENDSLYLDQGLILKTHPKALQAFEQACENIALKIAALKPETDWNLGIYHDSL